MAKAAKATKVTRWTAVGRCLRHRCPGCGGGNLFAGAWRMREACPSCGLPLEAGDGFFLGSMTLNYGLVVFGALAPVAGLWLTERLSDGWALGLAVAATAALPAALYRPSKCWWLACYYGFLPSELPAHRGDVSRPSWRRRP